MKLRYSDVVSTVSMFESYTVLHTELAQQHSVDNVIETRMCL